MKIWAALSNAFAGWLLLARGEAGWEKHFVLTAAGLATAVVLFVLFAALSIAFASIGVNLPTLEGMLAGLLVQCLSILALVLAVLGTRRAVPGDGSVLLLLVPGLYALVFYLVLGTILSLVGGFALLVLWAALGFLFYRLGRMAGQWSHGVAIAFALLTMALLVGMPMTLYMLTGPVAISSP